MLQVEMTDDIRKYQPKFMGPFTVRQCVCILIALVVAIPITIIFPVSQPSYKIFVFCIAMAPIVACGYIKLDGAYFEVLLLRAIYTMFLSSPKRKQVSHNTIAEYLEYLNKQKEKKMMSKMTKRQLKKYNAAKESKKVVRYYNNTPAEKQFKIYK